MVKKFKYSQSVQNSLKSSVSEQRLSKFLQETQGDLEKAFQLYTWDTAISSAFYGPLQGVEVTLRNALHREMTKLHDENWFDEPRCQLNYSSNLKIENAKKELRKAKKPLESGRIVAELSLGFWVSLLGSGGKKYNYEMNLWRPALYKASPHKKLSRKEAHKRLDFLRNFRNRIAHHEPIFHRDLKADYKSILEVSGWICPDTAKWIEHHSRVEEILKTEEVDFI